MAKEAETEDQLKVFGVMWTGLLITSTGLMIIILVFGDRWLNITLVLMLSALKFISGFGLILSVLSLGMRWLEENAYRFKGKDKIGDLKKYQMLLLVIPGLLLIYKGPVKLIQNIANPGDMENIFDKILFLYGALSLISSLYLVPLFKHEFLPESEEITFKDKIIRKKEDIKQKLKIKWYQFRKNLGKIQIHEQKNIHDYLQEWKINFAHYGLIALGLGMIIFTPIAVIFLAFWVRVFMMDEKELFNFERYFLITAHIVTLLIVILIPFSFQRTGYYEDIQNYYYLIDLGTFLGLVLGVWLYWKEMRDSDFNTWLSEKEEKYEEKEAKRIRKEQRKIAREQGKYQRILQKKRIRLRKMDKIGATESKGGSLGTKKGKNPLSGIKAMFVKMNKPESKNPSKMETETKHKSKLRRWTLKRKKKGN